MSELFGDLFNQEDNQNNFFNSNPLLPSKRHPSNLAGLQNRSATCYLNSLLQVLYFTEKFRGNFKSTLITNTSFIK